MVHVSVTPVRKETVNRSGATDADNLPIIVNVCCLRIASRIGDVQVSDSTSAQNEGHFRKKVVKPDEVPRIIDAKKNSRAGYDDSGKAAADIRKPTGTG
jgi:hypothetical protein